MKVFIIDNSMMTWAWITKIALHTDDLEFVGFNVKDEDAIHKFNIYEPDFVILNYNIFQENSVNILKEMQHIRPGTSFAMLSNNTHPELKEKCIKMGIECLFIHTKDYYQKIHEILLNTALSNKLYREWYNISLNN